MRAIRHARLLVIAATIAVIAILPSTLDGYHEGLAARVAVYFVAILGLNAGTGVIHAVQHGALLGKHQQEREQQCER